MELAFPVRRPAPPAISCGEPAPRARGEERRGEAFYGAVQPAPVLYDGRGPRLKAQLPAYLPSLDR